MGSKITIFRVLRNGWQNFWRHFWLSAAAISVMSVTLFVISVLLVLTFLANLSLINIKEKVDISVYFKNGTQEQTIREIENNIKGMANVTETRYITADEVLVEFERRNENKPLIIAALEELGYNPFYPTLVVKASDIGQFGAIAAEIANRQFPEVQKVNYEDNRPAIEVLGKLTDGLTKGGLALAILFAFISVMVMYNTIRLTIYNRREEIEIMRLVGATNAYIRWPFLVEGLLYGLISVVLTMIVLLPILSSFIPRLNYYLGINLDTDSLRDWGLLWELVILQVLLGLFLGIVSSVFAIRRYLRER